MGARAFCFFGRREEKAKPLQGKSHSVGMKREQTGLTRSAITFCIPLRLSRARLNPDGLRSNWLAIGFSAEAELVAPMGNALSLFW